MREKPEQGRARVVIEGVRPEIDAGRFPIKRVVGETVTVEADAFADGHDAVACALMHRRQGERSWRETRMEPLGNDRWRAGFPVAEIGRYQYTLRAWVDRFETWRRDLRKRIEAEQDVEVDLAIGAELVEEAIDRVPARQARALKPWPPLLREGARLEGAGEGRGGPETAVPGGGAAGGGPEGRLERALDEELASLMSGAFSRLRDTRYGKRLEVVVDRERAVFGAWYEMFPRSCLPEDRGQEPEDRGQEPEDPGGEESERPRHGTFRSAEARLPYVSELGFDVLYLPPIHPIGHTRRKGPNSRPEAAPGDPGSPWAIGSGAGGHKAVHPELGTLEDFRRFRERAEGHGLEIALDVAFQCSPDHPYLREHPEWFRRRPDGTVQYAENPPKKYEDIYPFDFETEDWPALWDELRSVFRFWIERGVRIFRVDNPHTKPFAFWEWLIGSVKEEHPDVIFLSEAFTRPKVMYRLAKLGFTQSYTYFAWRNSKRELTEYLTELTRTEVREYFRPNLWPNTPDILTEYLQKGGGPALRVRLALAATLGASYGIYGPAFELAEVTPRQPGSEEYLNSEKYEVKDWDLRAARSLAPFLSRVNRIRRENPALRSNRALRFQATDNERLLAYSKRDETEGNVILVVVNLDPDYPQSGWTDLNLGELGLDAEASFEAHDLLGGERYRWEGARNYVELRPDTSPAHIFRVRASARAGRPGTGESSEAGASGPGPGAGRGAR